MATVNAKSLRSEVQAVKEQLAELRAVGEVSPQLDAVLSTLLSLLDLLVAVALEKLTRKSSRNSCIPPSQMDAPDDTAQRPKQRQRAARDNRQSSPNLERVTLAETLSVTACDSCGADLSQLAVLDRERRIQYDILFRAVERRVTAEVKQCPACHSRSKAQFPANLPGPRQYGSGLQAFVSNLLVAHMLSLRRVVGLVQTLSGWRLSEATCLGYIRRLHTALQAWQDAASACLLAAPALHADETGLRVERKNHWLHVLTDGALTLKFVQPSRGRQAIEEIGLIPRFRGTLVHDCWAAYFGYQKCRHQLCGAHLLRELTFIVESNAYRWARLLKALLKQACHTVNQSHSKVVDAPAYKALRKRYRTILTQGAKAMPAIPPRSQGRRGRVAKSAAHNLHERLVKHEDSVLRFLREKAVSFTNNSGERAVRAAKTKIKVSGCFRTLAFAQYYARISSYLQSMAALGYNSLVAIQLALDGKAVEILEQHYGPIPTEGTGSE